MRTNSKENVKCLLCNEEIQIPHETATTNNIIAANVTIAPQDATTATLQAECETIKPDLYPNSNMDAHQKLIARTLSNVAAVHQEQGQAQLIKHILAAYANGGGNSTLRDDFFLTLFNHTNQNHTPVASQSANNAGVQNPAAQTKIPVVGTAVQGLPYDHAEKKIIITYCGNFLHYNCALNATNHAPTTQPATYGLVARNRVHPNTTSESNYGDLDKAVDNLVYTNNPSGHIKRFIHCRCAKCQILDNVPFALILTPLHNFDETNEVDYHDGKPRIDALRYRKPSTQDIQDAHRSNALGAASNQKTSQIYAPTGIGAAAQDAVEPLYATTSVQYNHVPRVDSTNSTYSHLHGQGEQGQRLEAELKNKIKAHWKNQVTPLSITNNADRKLLPPAIFASCIGKATEGGLPLSDAIEKLDTFHSTAWQKATAKPYGCKIATPNPQHFVSGRGEVNRQASLSYADFIFMIDKCFLFGDLTGAMVVHSECGCCIGLTQYLDTHRNHRHISKASNTKKDSWNVSFCCPTHSRKVTDATVEAPDSVVIFRKELLMAEDNQRNVGQIPTEANAETFYKPLTPYIAQEHEEILAAMRNADILIVGGGRTAIANTTYNAMSQAHQYDSAAPDPARNNTRSRYDKPEKAALYLDVVPKANATTQNTADMYPLHTPAGQNTELYLDVNPPTTHTPAGNNAQSLYDLEEVVGLNPDDEMKGYIYTSGANDTITAATTINPAYNSTQSTTDDDEQYAVVGPADTSHQNSRFSVHKNESIENGANVARAHIYLTANKIVRARAVPAGGVNVIQQEPSLNWLQRNRKPVGATAVGLVVLGIILATTLAGSDDDSPTNTIPPEGGDPVNNNCFNYNASLGYIYDAISAQMPSFSSKNCRTVAEVLTPIIERVNATFSSSCRADFITATNGLVRSNNITLPIAQDIVLAFDNMIGHCPAPCVSELAPLVTNFTRVASSVGLSAIYSLSQVNGTLFINLPGGGRTPVDESTPYLDAIPPRLVSYAQSQGFDGVTDETSLIGLDNITENIIGTNLRLIDGLGAFNMCTPQLDLLESYINNIKDYIYNLALTEHLISSSTGSTFTSTEPSSTSTSSSSSTTRPSLTTVSHVTGITTGTSMTPSVTTGTGITPSVTATTTTNIINSTISTLTTENSAITNPSEDDDA